MLNKSQIKNIVRNIMESKDYKNQPPEKTVLGPSGKRIHGSALGALRQAQTTNKVRNAVTADMEKIAPGATDKTHAKVVNHFQELRDKIAKIIEHPATTPVLKKRLNSARAISRLDDVIRSLTKGEND